jgi:mannonate dehydratase
MGQTDLLVSNRYVQDLCAKYTKVLFGASINPNRGELNARGELERVIAGADGLAPAALLKLLPNSQRVQLDSADHLWFWSTLANAQVPLLCHCGPEHAVPVHPESNQLLGDPRLLTNALRAEGGSLKVIVAHAATKYFPWENQDYLDILAGMMSQYPNLYADLSAMCNIARQETVFRVLDKIPPERLLLGSDYPVPVDVLFPKPPHYTWSEAESLLKVTNPYDQNYLELLALGFDAQIGTRFWESLLPHGAKEWRAAH